MRFLLVPLGSFVFSRVPWDSLDFLKIPLGSSALPDIVGLNGFQSCQILAWNLDDTSNDNEWKDA